MFLTMNFKIIGLFLNSLLGVTSLLLPVHMASLLGYGKNLTTLGATEFRATYGAFFISLGIFGFYFNTPEVTKLIGLSWLSAGIVRLIIFFFNRKDVKANLLGLLIEFGIAVLIIFG
jgi:hypothetical protein